jgi:predicted MFS family arabinose efflux permease
MTLLPYEVVSLADQYGAGTVGAGWIVAAELLAVAASAAWFGRTIDARDKRRLATVGVVLALGASVGSIAVASFIALIVMRLLFGVACGMLAAATNALPTLDADPERVFAAMQVAVGVIFGVATYAAGYASLHLDREYVFFIHLALIVLFGGGALVLPRGILAEASSAAAATPSALSSPVIACIAAAGLTWAALSGVWAFAEQAGSAANVSPESLALWFAVSGFLTPLGGVAAATLGERQGYKRPLIAGFTILIGVCLAMYVFRTSPMYVAGLLLLNFPITFVMSYLMALLAGLDHSGRGPSVGGAAINFGGAAGPALGAVALTGQDLSVVGFIGAALLLAALALSTWSAIRFRSAVA